MSVVAHKQQSVEDVFEENKEYLLQEHRNKYAWIVNGELREIFDTQEEFYKYLLEHNPKNKGTIAKIQPDGDHFDIYIG